MKWIVGLTGTLSVLFTLLMAGLMALRLTGRIANYRVEVDGKEFTAPSTGGPIRYRDKDGATSELVVPQHHVLTLGDNTSRSFDGRYWGCLPMDRIIQRALRIYWPPERAGAIR